MDPNEDISKIFLHPQQQVQVGKPRGKFSRRGSFTSKSNSSNVQINPSETAISKNDNSLNENNNAQNLKSSSPVSSASSSSSSYLSSGYSSSASTSTTPLQLNESLMASSIGENNSSSNSSGSNNSKSPVSNITNLNSKDESDEVLPYEYYSTNSQTVNKKAISNAVDILARAASDKNVSFFIFIFKEIFVCLLNFK